MSVTPPFQLPIETIEQLQELNQQLSNQRGRFLSRLDRYLVDSTDDEGSRFEKCHKILSMLLSPRLLLLLHGHCSFDISIQACCNLRNFLRVDNGSLIQKVYRGQLHFIAI